MKLLPSAHPAAPASLVAFPFTCSWGTAEDLAGAAWGSPYGGLPEPEFSSLPLRRGGQIGSAVF